MSSVNPDYPPLWEFKSDNLPSEKWRCINALSYLAEHPEASSSEWSGRCAKLLAKTNISEMPEVQRIIPILCEKYPQLFPRLTVIIGKEKKEILEDRLSLLSEKFKTLFSLPSQVKESITHTIDLTEEMPEESAAAKAFLNYLALGKFDTQEANIISLFAFAHAQQVPSLVKKCLELLEKELDDESFPAFFNIAAEMPHPDLRWICLSYFSNRLKSVETEAERTAIQRTLLPDPSSPQAVSFLKEATPFFLSQNISISPLSENRYIRTVTLYDSKLAPNELGALKALHSSYEIQGIFTFQATSSFDSLKFIESPKAITINEMGQPTAVDIPKEWIQSAKSIHLVNCIAPSLKEVNAPNAIWLHFSVCTPMEKLVAPKALHVTCMHSYYLTTLNVPNATSVDCGPCISLPSLDLPSALSVTCHDCPSLVTLTAPKATYVYLYNDLRNFKEMTVSSACVISKTVECSVSYVRDK